MAEAARRMGQGLGADVARRLIARPIRLQPRAPAQEMQPQRSDAGALPIDATRRLETEILLMKAVLKAERAENARLRATVLIDDEPLGAEARAMRDRWASLVDRMMIAAR